VNFSESEIQKAKELKKLRLEEKAELAPTAGSFLFGRHCPEACVQIDGQVFLLIDEKFDSSAYVWLPTFDELLAISRKLKISFSFVTDFLHRRRFADGREREGIYQLLIERLR
jgi:hypothetical protein